MSADNWAKCPRCAKRRAVELEAREANITAAYGKIPVDQFDRLHEQLASDYVKAREADWTFREDYEIYGAEDGLVVVSYGGSCAECGLSLSFQSEHPLDVDGA